MTNAIVELIITSTNNAVFMMNALPEQIEKVNVTRLKEHTLKEVKGLHEEKKGRYSMLMIEGSVGRAVFEASQNSMVDEGVILSKAAGIVRNNLFSQDQSFDGNLASDPKSLLPIHLPIHTPFGSNL